MAARLILTLSICALISSVAQASPRSDPTTGRAVFTGVTVPHATSIALDPAALGLGFVNEIYFALTGVVQQLGIDTGTLDVTTGAVAPGPSVRDTQLGPGGMAGFIWKTSERLTLGFEARLPPPEMQPEDHEPLRYHTLGNGQRNYLATVGVSFKITNRFYFGASLSHENTYLKLRYALDTALEAGTGPGGIDSDCGGGPCGIENAAATELYVVDVRSPILSTANLRLNLGTVVRVAPGVWIGIAYHTPPGFDIQTSLEGTMDVTQAPRDGGLVLHGASVVYVSYPASVDAELRAELPRDLELHVGARWEDLSRMQAYDVRGFGSTFGPAGIPERALRARGMEDSFAIWGGVEQIDRGGVIRTGGRLGLETAALDDNRTSALTISPTSLTLDVGIQARATEGAPWSLQLSYGLAYFLSANVTDSAFDPRFQIDCIESGYDYNTLGCRAVRNGYALPTAAGDYAKLEHALRIGFRYELR